MVWAASLTAFFGSFRLGEILPKSENYDVEETLVWSDVKFRNEDSQEFSFLEGIEPSEDLRDC